MCNGKTLSETTILTALVTPFYAGAALTGIVV